MSNTPHVMQSAPGAVTAIDGREYLYFVGTGYHALQGHPELIAACAEGARRYGTGSGTARTGFGNNPALLEVERAAAEFFGAEDSVYYVSGYLGFSIYAEILREDHDLFLLDELSHYSVLAGMRQCGAQYVTFRHADPGSLADTLKQRLRPGQRPLVVSDGVFPIGGDIAPADEYARILADYDGWGIYLDDAHGVGVLGAAGRGVYEHLGLAGPQFHFSGTLSKAFGGHGGVIPGPRDVIGRIRATSHWIIGSSPTPPSLALATVRGIAILREHPELLTRLRENVRFVKDSLRALGLPMNDTPMPIVCITAGGREKLASMQAELMRRGIAVAFVDNYAGVGADGAIRIAIFSAHTREMLERLVREIGTLL